MTNFVSLSHGYYINSDQIQEMNTQEDGTGVIYLPFGPRTLSKEDFNTVLKSISITNKSALPIKNTI